MRPLSPSLVRYGHSPSKKQKTVLPKTGTLFDYLPPKNANLLSSGLYCVDLFCGIGGWSCGAKEAGHTIALAIDNNEHALEVHMRNHPRTKHICMNLGDGTEKALRKQIESVVPKGAKWHLHMSPPCQTVSGLQCIQKDGIKKSINVGMDLVNWCLKMVVELAPNSWSFEQVSHPEIIGVMRFFKYLYPDVISYSRVNFAEYGVAQNRIRMLAGSPGIMETFLTNPLLRASPPHVSDLLVVPDNAVWQRASVGKTPNPKATVLNSDGSYSNSSIRWDVRTIHEVSWTCTARHPHAYLTADYKHIRDQTPRETATLQSFPESYRISASKPNKTKEQKAVGNAIPPLIARKLMEGV